MAQKNLSPGSFPAGALVTAHYRGDNTLAPLGPTIATATAAADGSVVFTALPGGTPLTAASGARRVNFTSSPMTPARGPHPGPLDFY